MMSHQSVRPCAGAGAGLIPQRPPKGLRRPEITTCTEGACHVETPAAQRPTGSVGPAEAWWNDAPADGHGGLDGTGSARYGHSTGIGGPRWHQDLHRDWSQPPL